MEHKKVRCIDNNTIYPLTIGEKYEVIYELGQTYNIICDNGIQYSILKLRFEEIKENSEPTHYKMRITPLQFITENEIPFVEGNIIKYICRYKKKNGKEDLLKAKDYLEHLIKEYDRAGS